MKRIEGQPSSYEAYTNSAVLLPKGKVGKTADRLCGCMVPVILYPTSAVLGHFGSLGIKHAQENLELPIFKQLREEKPASTLMFHLDSWYTEYDEQYPYRIGLMRHTVAKAVGITPEQISLRTYNLNSEVVVDWRMPTPKPIIYTRPSSQIS